MPGESSLLSTGSQQAGGCPTIDCCEVSEPPGARATAPSYDAWRRTIVLLARASLVPNQEPVPIGFGFLSLLVEDGHGDRDAQCLSHAVIHPPERPLHILGIPLDLVLPVIDHFHLFVRSAVANELSEVVLTLLFL